MDDLFCKIFVDTATPPLAFAELLGEGLDSAVEGKLVRSGVLEIEVLKTDHLAVGPPPRSFLGFKTILEVSSIGESVTQSQLVRELAHLLTVMGALNLRFVSIDFEDDLPFNGRNVEI